MGKKSFLSSVFSGRNAKRLFGSVPTIIRTKNKNGVTTNAETCIITNVLTICFICDVISQGVYCNIIYY